MEYTCVKAVYFSPAKNTQLAVRTIANAAAKKLGLPLQELDFTLPAARLEKTQFSPDQLVVFGTPVYAGRVPNKISPWVAEGFLGNGAAACAVVTFGNRSFDNALAELCSLLSQDGFSVLAACAVVAEHSFTAKLAPGRPNKEDIQALCQFGEAFAQKAQENKPAAPLAVPGQADAPYYTPRGTDGKPAVFLKAKPLTDPAKCNQCADCVKVCPMGSISAQDPSQVTGICIKCQACIKSCPTGAKYFADEAFLSHVAMLEQNFTRPAESTWYI